MFLLSSINSREEAFYHIFFAFYHVLDMIKRDCLSVLNDFKYAAS